MDSIDFGSCSVGCLDYFAAHGHGQFIHPSERLFLLWLWLVPCVLLYALGWAVVWIIRGFKGRDLGTVLSGG